MALIGQAQLRGMLNSIMAPMMAKTILTFRSLCESFFIFNRIAFFMLILFLVVLLEVFSYYLACWAAWPTILLLKAVKTDHQIKSANLG